jgi:hypothetical protein
MYSGVTDGFNQKFYQLPEYYTTPTHPPPSIRKARILTLFPSQELCVKLGAVSGGQTRVQALLLRQGCRNALPHVTLEYSSPHLPPSYFSHGCLLFRRTVTSASRRSQGIDGVLRRSKTSRFIYPALPLRDAAMKAAMSRVLEVSLVSATAAGRRC